MQLIPNTLKAIAIAAVLLHSGASFCQAHHRHARSNTSHLRHVSFTSKLTDEKKGYNLIVTTYQPSKFKVTINGHKIKDGQTINVPVENNKFLIRYDYEFKAMLKKFVGYREVEFELDPVRDHYSIDFSWKHEHRFIIHHANFIRITQMDEPGSQYAQ